MTKERGYVVDYKGQKLKILLELLSITEENTVSYYYEVLLKTSEANGNLKITDVDDIKSIYNPLQYIHNNYSDKDISKYILVDTIVKTIINKIIEKLYRENDISINFKSDSSSYDIYKNNSIKKENEYYSDNNNNNIEKYYIAKQFLMMNTHNNSSTKYNDYKAIIKDLITKERRGNR